MNCGKLLIRLTATPVRVFYLMVAFSGYPNHVVALSGITITESSVSHELVDDMYYNV